MVGTTYANIESNNPVDVMEYAHSAAVTAHKPICVAGLGVLLPIASLGANVTGAYARKGRYNFCVTSATVVTAGAKVYYDTATDKIILTVPAAGFFLGVAAEAATGNAGGTVYCPIFINENELAPDLTTIHVSTSGDDTYGDGSEARPYKTINAAYAAASATKKHIVLRSGQHTLSEGIDIDINGISFTGIGSVSIKGDATSDYLFKTVFGASSGTKEFSFKNVQFDHTGKSTQIGLQFDNVGATAKINCYLDNVSFNASATGNSIDVDETVTTQGVRIYMTNGGGNEVEGPVNISVKNDGTRLRAHGYRFTGGIVTSADAVAAEISLWACGVKHEGVTGGNAAQTVNAIGCWSETNADPNVIAGLDTNDLAGSHTEVISPVPGEGV